MRGHWRRLLIQIAILVTMVVVNTINTDLYLVVIALTLLALPAASWTVFALLLWTSRQAPDIQSLHERVDDALTLAIVATVAAVIGAYVLARFLHVIDGSLSGLITVGIGFIVVEVSLPAIGFLGTWRDVYLPMVRGKQVEAEIERLDIRHEVSMDAMERRLTGLIDANTALTQKASDHADAAYREANTINEKIASVGITPETTQQVDEIHQATVEES